ncbi:hypothetical protein LY76DRAFT_291813 [Colletotrichum caudatum]|nr:hypothetical protein LY76DRAFT_291813 [Colletotrichum caudatum]
MAENRCRTKWPQRSSSSEFCLVVTLLISPRLLDATLTGVGTPGAVRLIPSAQSFPINHSSHASTRRGKGPRWDCREHHMWFSKCRYPGPLITMRTKVLTALGD